MAGDSTHTHTRKNRAGPGARPGQSATPRLPPCQSGVPHTPSMRSVIPVRARSLSPTACGLEIEAATYTMRAHALGTLSRHFARNDTLAICEQVEGSRLTPRARERAAACAR
eukprot:2648859-Prymnesium_polylepis.1